MRFYQEIIEFLRCSSGFHQIATSGIFITFPICDTKLCVQFPLQFLPDCVKTKKPFSLIRFVTEQQKK